MRSNPFDPIYQILDSGATHTTSQEMPLLIDIEITNACNFNCLFCYTGTKAHKRATGFMTKKVYEQIISEIAPHKIPLRFSRWGEPTLHKEFLEFIKIAKDSGIMCHVNTNGSLMDEQMMEQLLSVELDSLKFSFQGTDEKTYSEMRYGQSFSKLVDTVKLFSKLRGDLPYPYLHATTTITYETPEMVQKFKDLLNPFCDLVTTGHTKLSHISPEQIKLPKEAKKLLENLKHSESLEKVYKRCVEVYDKLSINWDGTVSACCGDYDNYMLVGNLGGVQCRSIHDIWKNSEELKHYRAVLSDGKHAELPLCKECYYSMDLGAKLQIVK